MDRFIFSDQRIVLCVFLPAAASQYSSRVIGSSQQQTLLLTSMSASFKGWFWNDFHIKWYSNALQKLTTWWLFSYQIPNHNSVENKIDCGTKTSVNLKFLNTKAWFLVVDIATRFFIAKFVDGKGSSYGQSAEGAWIPLIEGQCVLYIRIPNVIRLNQRF